PIQGAIHGWRGATRQARAVDGALALRDSGRQSRSGRRAGGEWRAREARGQALRKDAQSPPSANRREAIFQLTADSVSRAARGGGSRPGSLSFHGRARATLHRTSSICSSITGIRLAWGAITAPPTSA